MKKIILILVVFTLITKMQAQTLTPATAATLAAQAATQAQTTLTQAQQLAAQASQSATAAQAAASLATGDEQAAALEAANAAQKASNSAQEYLNVVNDAANSATEYAAKSASCALYYTSTQSGDDEKCAIESYKRTVDQLRVVNIANSNCKEAAFAASQAATEASQYKIQIVFTVTHNGCSGRSLGNITATITGGTPPYHIKWSNGDVDVTSITNLKSEYYSCYVWDNYHHESEEEVYIKEPEPIRIKQFEPFVHGNGFNTSCFLCFDGSINVLVEGGQAPYTYLWNDGSTLQNRTNLAPKTYLLEIKDAAGCKFEKELNITLVSPEREDWTVAGFSNNNATNFIGTKSGSPYPDLIFKSNNNEGFRLLPDGKLGIGTTTPTEKLDIDGRIRVRGINSNFSTIPFAIGETRLVSTDADGNLRDEYVDVRGGTNCTKMVLGWSARPSLNISMAYSTPSGLTVYPPDLTHPDDIIKCPQAGNVGIGVLQPNFKVDVDGDINATGYRLNGSPALFSQWATIPTTAYSSTPSISYPNHVMVNDNNGASLILQSNNGSAAIGSSSGTVNFSLPNGTGVLYNSIVVGGITTKGEIVVGSSSDNKSILVYGEMHSKKVKVCGGGWCDYVFEKDFKLTPLFEVEKYIQANKHLPEVPSATEVANNEVDLFEMQKIQMKKIEELTLYLIELKKENQELKRAINK